MSRTSTPATPERVEQTSSPSGPKPALRSSADAQTDGAWMPSTESMLDGSAIEHRVVRDSIKARLFPSLTSGGSDGGDGDPLAIPRIGRFAILRKLGQGGMGVVFLAYDEDLDRKVALKLLQRARDPHRSRARLTREAQALARLSHPNVVGIHEIGEHDGQVYIAMEYVRGRTLRRWLDTQPRPWREVLAVLLQAGRGLEAAHAAGLVHRDFKPDNVLVGEDGRVRVVDFGLVRADELSTQEHVHESTLEASLSSSGDRPLTQALTQTGAILGTPIYMPLEQHLGGSADALGDQYSFCFTAWEALLGRRPFEGDTHAQLLDALRAKAIVDPPSDRPRAAQVPRSLRADLERGLDGDPRKRWSSLAELLERMEAALAPRRRAPAVMLGAVVISATFALGLAAASADQDARTPPQCELGLELLAGTWDADVATRVHDSFTGTGLRYAEQAEQQVRTRLDAWAAEWIDVQRRACVATRIDKLASEQLLDRRSACLGDQRADVAGLVAILRTADARVVERSGVLLDRLPDPHACERATVLDPMAPPPLPNDPNARAALLAARERLGQAGALRAAGRGDDAATLARALSASTTDAALLREVEAELGFIELAFGRAPGRRSATVERLRKLAGEAELAGDERLAAELRVELAHLAADDLASPQFERWLLDDARVALERIGGDERRMAWLEFAEARVAQHDGELSRARTSFIELLERADARGWPDLGAVASMQLAIVHDSLGEASEAGYMDARSRSVALFGEGHPRVAQVDLADAQRALAHGQLDRAAALLDRAEPILLASHGQASLGHAWVETTRAHLAAQEGRWDAALALVESALAVHVAELGRDHEETARLHDLRATLRFFVGDLEGALDDYEHARRVFERRFEPGHETLVVLWANMGDTLLALGRLREAQRAFDESLAHLDQLDQLDQPDMPDMPDMPDTKPGRTHPLAAVALAGRGEIALAEGRPDAAIGDLEAALALLDGHDGDAAERAATQLSLARALDAVEREPERAQTLQDSARTTFAALGLPEPD
jgi:tRNA A-37 threonylcarbamoyl transferase component Bud32/tetratricopeptide (TPR) repeat protein